MKTKTNVKAGSLYASCCNGKHIATGTIVV